MSSRCRAFAAALLLASTSGLFSLRAESSYRLSALRRAPAGGSEDRPGELIVQFRIASEELDVERALRDAGAVRGRKSRFGARYLVTLDAGVAFSEAAARLRALPEVDYAEPNGRVHAFFNPNDPGFRFQWHFRLIGAPRMWDIQKGDPSVTVAVLDTGIAYEDFGPFRKAPDWGTTRFVTGFNALTGDSHANDDEGHGTNVASTIAEGTNNGTGYSGLAFNCALMPVKVLDNHGEGSFFDVAEGVDFASSHGAKVINLSLGGDSSSETMRRAVDRAVSAGAVVVAAAGNDGTSDVAFPASLPNVISVGATAVRKHLAFYSNYGPELDVVAPGGDFDRDDDGDGIPDGIFQQNLDPDAVAEGRYDVFTYNVIYEGTSQATPHVSALAALLIRQGITDPRAVKAAIESTAEDLGATGRDDSFGFGLIRPDKALSGLGFNQ